MNLAKQSTAKKFIIGPILDADGVAKTDEVVASIKVTKNGTVGAVDAQSTLTHNHTGHYVFDAVDGGDFDTLGEVEFSLNSTTNAMAPVKFQVLSAATYDALVTNAAGAANGMVIAGANAATTFATLTSTGAFTCGSTSLGAVTATTITASGAVALQSTVTVTGATTLTGGLAANAVTATTIAASGAVTAASFTLSGELQAATIVSTGTTRLNALTVTNAATLGTLTVSGATTLAAITQTGAASFGVGSTVTFATLAVTGALSANSLAVATTTALTGAVTLGASLSVATTTTFTGVVSATAANDIRGVKIGGILATALPTESVEGRDAAAFGRLLDVATPVLTVASVNQTGDSYSYLGTNLGALGAAATALAPSATALSTATWTGTKAGYIDVAISSRGTGTSTLSTTDLDARGITTSNKAQTGDGYSYLTTNLGLLGAAATALAPASTALSSVVWTNTKAGYVDAAISGRQATISGIDTAVATIAKLDTTVVQDGAVYDFTAAALAAGPSGGTPLTAQETRDAMKLAPTAGDPAAGSVDKHLDDILGDTNELQTDWTNGGRLDLLLDAAAGASSGTGARTCTLTVNDGATALEGARIRVTKGAESYVGATNVSGVKVFNLDDGTWTVAITLGGYTYAGTTLVVDGTESVTYSMTAASFTPSTQPSTVTVRWTVIGSDDFLPVGAGVVVYIRIKTPPTDDGFIWGKGNRYDTTDANGKVEFTDVPIGCTLLCRCGSTGEWLEIEIPATATSPYDAGEFIGVAVT